MIILHYKPVEDIDSCGHNSDNERDTNTLMDIREDLDGIFTKLFNLRNKTEPSDRTYNLSTQLTVCYLIVATLSAFITANYLDLLENLELKVLIPLAILCFFIFFLLFSLGLQPRNNEKISFKVPMVPYLPGLSIFINIYLMMKLSIATWVRFFVWLFIGLLIYLFYGVRNSSENPKNFSHNQTETLSHDSVNYYGSTDKDQ